MLDDFLFGCFESFFKLLNILGGRQVFQSREFFVDIVGVEAEGVELAENFLEQLFHVAVAEAIEVEDAVEVRRRFNT